MYVIKKLTVIDLRPRAAATAAYSFFFSSPPSERRWPPRRTDWKAVQADLRETLSYRPLVLQLVSLHVRAAKLVLCIFIPATVLRHVSERSTSPLPVKVILLLKTAPPHVPIRLNAKERGFGLLLKPCGDADC